MEHRTQTEGGFSQQTFSGRAGTRTRPEVQVWVGVQSVEYET